MKKQLLFFLIFLSVGASSFAQHHLMPVPSSVEWGEQRFDIDKGFYVVMDQLQGTRSSKAVERFLRTLDNRTHLLIAKNHVSKVQMGKGLYLFIRFSREGKLSPHENESYELKITGDQAILEAETDLGVMHGLQTFLQLVEHDDKGYFLKGCHINDRPRFTWRGLLIDVCRHFSPVDVIKRNIDGMAMMKMNVLHLHLSEDQGFRIESKKFPKLHLMGSNGDYYTQEQIKDIIRYAADRGIRVVPEFDMPGHATAWFVGHPELASAPGPYQIEKKFGVFDPTIDPTKKTTYRFLAKFIGEMTALFPDEYFHIGGDENEGKHWDKNKDIQEFKKKKGLKDNHELQNYFNIKLLAILKKNKKKMIGWDEILQPGLPKDAIIQSWRGKEGLKKAATEGYEVILSNGYYIDLVQPAWQHYTNDPMPADLGLNPEQQKYILGGEATMWAELVTPETIDSRIWPRTAAIAERLWSPREVNNVPDMYRRLEKISLQLEDAGLLHIRNQEMMLRRIAGHDDIDALKKLVSVVEPLEGYQRHHQGVAYSTDLPFTRLPDIAFPESDEARKFRLLCEQLIMKKDDSVREAIEKHLNSWISNHDEVIKVCSNNPGLKNWVAISQSLKEASQCGLESLDFMNRRQVITDQWTSDSHQKLESAKKPVEEAELAVIESIIMLFNHALPK